jgi:hypothetical protein
MSSFAFDFDLEDDLDESFDAITASAIDKTLVSKSVPGGEMLPAEEIPLSTLVRDRDTFLKMSDLFLTTNLIWVWQRSSPHSPKHSHIRL